MGLGSFPTVTFTLGLWMCGSVPEHFKTDFFTPYSPIILLEVSPIGCQGQVLWKLISPVQFPNVGMPDVRHKLLAPQGQYPYYEILPD